MALEEKGAGLRSFAPPYSLSLHRFSSSHGLITGSELVVRNRSGALSSPLVVLFSNECKSFSKLFPFDTINRKGRKCHICVNWMLPVLLLLPKDSKPSMR